MLGTMAQRMAHDSPAANRFARSGAVLLAGTLVSNVLSYAFFVVLSRRVAQADLGGIGSMVNLSVILGVPALGLQLVAARLVARRAHHGDHGRDLERRLLRASISLGAGSAVVLAVLSPIVSGVLDVSVLTVLLLAGGMVPIAVLLATQGLLQGRERFTALAVVLALVGVGKLLAALLAGAVSDSRGHPTALIVGLYGLGLAMVAAVGAAVALSGGRPTAGAAPASPGGDIKPGASARLVRLIAAAAVPTSGLLFLAGIDVLLARHHLSPAASGQYTIGALFEKAAFWGMTFLATLFYPAMTDATRRRAALVRALVVTGALGLVGTLVTAAAGDRLAGLVGGPTFVSLGPDLWRFVAFGVTLALVQVLAYAGVAAASVRMGITMWAVSGAAIAWVALAGDSVGDIITILLLSAAGLVAAGLLIERATLVDPARRQGASVRRVVP